MNVQQHKELERHIVEVVKSNPEALVVRFDPDTRYIERLFPIHAPLGLARLLSMFTSACTEIFQSVGYRALKPGVWLSPAGWKVWEAYQAESQSQRRGSPYQEFYREEMNKKRWGQNREREDAQPFYGPFQGPNKGSVPYDAWKKAVDDIMTHTNSTGFSEAFKDMMEKMGVA